MNLERLREKWHETQAPQGCNGSEENLQEAVVRMGAQQLLGCCRKTPARSNEDLTGGRHRRTSPCLFSQGEVAVERRADQALPLPCATSTLPSVPAPCAKAVSVPQLCHSDWNMHFSSQMLNALKPSQACAVSISLSCACQTRTSP